MGAFVLASVPIFGHVSPMTRLAAELVDRGHQIRFITGRRFSALVQGTGAEFVPLPAGADFDDRVVNEGVDKAVRPDGIAGLRYDVANVFLRPARAQHQALRAALTQPTDAIVVDPTFVGAALLAATPRDQRPPLLVAGVLPLTLDSADSPPFGLGLSPLRTPAGVLDRMRNGLLRLLVQRLIFGPVQKDYDQLFRTTVGTSAPGFVMNWLQSADAIVQLSVPAFEYPRADASVPISFAGPMIRPTGADLPSWWSDLDSGRPVVLATQGTIANRDLDELIRPTIRAFTDTEVLLIVTTGGRPVAELGPLPSNVRAAEFLPYEQLFPRIDAFVTNGGYGGVHFALASGVPVVVAGAGEDKPEVAARVAWSGVGINLRTGRPRAPMIAKAVRRVISDESYRAAATATARQIADADGADALLAVVDQERLRSRSSQGWGVATRLTEEKLSEVAPGHPGTP